jgi:hypothetical protein
MQTIDIKTKRKSFDEVAEALLEGVSGPPTALREIFPRFNIKAAIESPLLPTAGKLVSVDDHYVIFYASNLTKARVEFTVAHELAHAVFDQMAEMPKLKGATLERACDHLAAALLMPKRAFTNRVGSPATIAGVAAAAREFNVSMHAAAARCEELYECLMFRTVDGVTEWKTRLAPVEEPPVKRLVKAAFAGDRDQQPVLLTAPGLTGLWTFECELQGATGTFLLRRKATPLRGARN